MCSLFFFFNDTATTEIYTLSLHDALPISRRAVRDSLGSAPHPGGLLPGGGTGGPGRPPGGLRGAVDARRRGAGCGCSCGATLRRVARLPASHPTRSLRANGRRVLGVRPV